MSFLQPTYLWALLGLIVPLIIHFWSQREGKTVKIGSIKLLDEADSKKSSSIQLNEWLLLALRMLVIAFIAIALAQPHKNTKRTTSEITYLIEPSLAHSEDISTLLDNVPSNADLRLFSEGFPLLDLDELPYQSHETPNYWQLANNLKSLRSDSIKIFTQGFLQGFKGMRPEVPANVQWMSIPTQKTRNAPVYAISQPNGYRIASVESTAERLSVQTGFISNTTSEFSLNSGEDSLVFETTENRIPLIRPQPLSVLLFYSEDFKQDAYYLEAATNALFTHMGREVEWTKMMDSIPPKLTNYDRVIYLADTTPSDSPNYTLSYRDNSLSNDLISDGNSANEYFLTERLNAENAVERRLSEALLPFYDLNSELETIISNTDLRIIDLTEFTPKVKEVTSRKDEATATPLTPWFWLLIGITLLVERFIAKLRLQ